MAASQKSDEGVRPYVFRASGARILLVISYLVAKFQRPTPDGSTPRVVTPASNNRDVKNVGTRPARIEFGANSLLHGKAAALVSTETNCGRSSVLQEGDECDLDGRPVFANDRTELHDTNRADNTGRPARYCTADKDVSAPSEGYNQAGNKRETEEVFHESPQNEHRPESTPGGRRAACV
jgi:hypothetical protein